MRTFLRFIFILFTTHFRIHYLRFTIFFIPEKWSFSMNFRENYCYVLVSSTITSHLMMTSLLFYQASLLDSLNKSSINRICRFRDHAQTLNERIRESNRFKHESFTERFTKSLISWYSFHDKERLKYESSSTSKQFVS